MVTNQLVECNVNPPYSTHDWVADHALDLPPANEKAWLVPHERLYLFSTEAPDNYDILDECNAAHSGYDDRDQRDTQEFEGAVGASLNLGVDILPDELHTFFLNVVDENLRLELQRAVLGGIQHESF